LQSTKSNCVDTHRAIGQAHNCGTCTVMDCC
jgi:hypothetical protein